MVPGISPPGKYFCFEIGKEKTPHRKTRARVFSRSVRTRDNPPFLQRAHGSCLTDRASLHCTRAAQYDSPSLSLPLPLSPLPPCPRNKPLKLIRCIMNQEHCKDKKTTQVLETRDMVNIQRRSGVRYRFAPVGVERPWLIFITEAGLQEFLDFSQKQK